MVGAGQQRGREQSAKRVMSVDLSGLDPSGNADAADATAIVLIVDDDAELRELLSAALTPRLRVQGAQTVSDGLMMWRAMRPDVLLLDLSLGDGSGIEVL